MDKRDALFDEKLSHHEGREGHEDRTTRASNLKKIFFLFVCFVVEFLPLVAAPRVQFHPHATTNTPTSETLRGKLR